MPLRRSIRIGAVILSLFLVVSLQATLGSSMAADNNRPTRETNESNQQVLREIDQSPPDPERDVLGWENGYWYNETLDINQRDGLSEQERRAYVARTMARVEFLRKLEFKRNVPIRVVSRQEAREQLRFDAPREYRSWQNQIWEAQFVVGEWSDFWNELQTVYGTTILGYYDQENDSFTIVTDDPDEVRFDDILLAHELTHALQDQHFNLSRPQLASPRTWNEQAGVRGLVEGDATYVDQQYFARCLAAWNCEETMLVNNRTVDNRRLNAGLNVWFSYPYSDGPAYIDFLRNQGGWKAVNSKYRDLPETSEVVIHPGRDANDATAVAVEDRARNGWNRFGTPLITAVSDNGTNSVGELGIFTMFWYQAYQNDIAIVDPGNLFVPNEGAFDELNYTSQPSEGWAGDRIVPYRKDGRFGYVWTTEWDTVRDAREFATAYRTVLVGHGAERRAPNAWVISNGEFADAFRVVHDGKRVTIVNGPTVTDVRDIRPTPANASEGRRGGENTVR